MTSSARPPLPPTPPGFELPFYYGSLTNIGVNYLVEPARVLPFLAGTGLTAALMRPDERETRRYACVSYNYQLYWAQFPTGSGTTQEIELNIIVYPEGAARFAPEVTFKQFIMGNEQTKLYGNHRVHVACDSDVAIDAGRTLFGEPKFKASFVTTMPSLNGRADVPWRISCNAPAGAEGTPGAMLWAFRADLTGLSSVPSSFAPISEYGTRDGRMLVAPWNILSPFANYLFGPSDAGRVELAYGQPQPNLPPMAQDLRAMVGDTPAASAFVVQSPPVAMQNRPYYVGRYDSERAVEAWDAVPVSSSI
jgi:hypothetical protein